MTAISAAVILLRRKACNTGVLLAVQVVLLGQALAAYEVFAQEDVVEVKHADSWRGTGVDDTFHLVGAVEIQHGDTALSSDSLHYQRAAGKLVLEGSVIIRRDQTVLRADHVVYLESERIAHATGSVWLRDEEQGVTLTGDEGQYFQIRKYADLTGNPRLVNQSGGRELEITGKRLEYFFPDVDSLRRAVVSDSVTIYDRAEEITVRCRRVVYRRSQEMASIYGSPELVKSGGDSDREILVKGVRMIYDVSAGQADVFDTVSVIRGNVRAECDTLLYTGDRAQLKGRPKLVDGSSEISGDDIVLTIDEESIRRAEVTGRAHAQYAPSAEADLFPGRRTSDSEISGHRLLVDFEEEAVSRIQAIQNAFSHYRSTNDTAVGPEGQNRVRAAEITIRLDRGKLLDVSASGAVTGSYTASTQVEAVP